jgi:sec-independent protein translocase protein TatB
MFDIGWSELLLIGAVALIAIGPKELPGALRTLGQWITKMRRMATEFQDQFKEAMREAEFADIKKEVDEMAAKAQSYARFDPIDDIRRDIETAASPPPELTTPLSSSASLAAPSAEVGAAAESAPAAIGPTVGLEPIPESLPAPPNLPASQSLPEPSAFPALPPAATVGIEHTAAAGPDIAKPDVMPDAKPDAGRAA